MSVNLNKKKSIKKEKNLELLSDMLYRLGIPELVVDLKHPWKIFWTNLLAGTARGLGFLLGAGFVIAIISYIVASLVNLPIIGEFFNNINQLLKQSTNIY
jgi:hypothetical protein